MKQIRIVSVGRGTPALGAPPAVVERELGAAGPTSSALYWSVTILVTIPTPIPKKMTFLMLSDASLTNATLPSVFAVIIR